MDWITHLMNAISQGLIFINDKRAKALYNEVAALRQEYSDELLKPYKDQSDLTLVTIQRRLLVINQTYLQFKPDSPNK